MGQNGGANRPRALPAKITRSTAHEIHPFSDIYGTNGVLDYVYNFSAYDPDDYLSGFWLGSGSECIMLFPSCCKF
jgi:hypothetical protein